MRYITFFCMIFLCTFSVHSQTRSGTDLSDEIILEVAKVDLIADGARCSIRVTNNSSSQLTNVVVNNELASGEVPKRIMRIVDECIIEIESSANNVTKTCSDAVTIAWENGKIMCNSSIVEPNGELKLYFDIEYEDDLKGVCSCSLNCDQMTMEKTVSTASIHNIEGYEQSSNRRGVNDCVPGDLCERSPGTSEDYCPCENCVTGSATPCYVAFHESCYPWPVDWLCFCARKPSISGIPCGDDGNECTSDVCSAGSCIHPNRFDNTPCSSDGNECTYDICIDGSCTHPSWPLGTSCSDDGNECTNDFCDGNGNCNSPKPLGTYCSTGIIDGCRREVCDGSGDCSLLQDRPSGTGCGNCGLCDGSGNCSPHPERCSGYHNICKKWFCYHTSTNAEECADYPNADGQSCDDDSDQCTLDICENDVCTHLPAPLGTYCSTGIIDGCRREVCDGSGDCSLLQDRPSGTGCGNCGLCDGSGNCSPHPERCSGYHNICKKWFCYHTSTNAEECADYPNADGQSCDDDSNDCMDDICSGDVCIHSPEPSGTPCTDDGNDCTDDICDGNGVCTHPPEPAGRPCASDGNDCTRDVCSAYGTCSVPEPSGIPCTDDGNDCTDDICDGSGICTHPHEINGESCVSAGGTVHSGCFSQMCLNGVCGHTVIGGCCLDDIDCYNLNDGCTEGYCDNTGPNNPVCSTKAKICSIDDDCTVPCGLIGDDSCTNLFCDSGACAHSPKENCCTEDIDCSHLDDGCTEGYCDTTTDPNNPVCLPRPKTCSIDADCTVPCGLITDAFSTNLFCDNGECASSPKENRCDADSDCVHLDDGCTEGYCDQSDPHNPMCLTKPKTCGIDADCTVPCGLIGDDSCTNLFCDSGACAHSPKENCCSDDIDCVHLDDGCTEGYCDTTTDPNNPVCLTRPKTCSIDADCAVPCGLIADDSCTNLFCDNGKCGHSSKENCCTEDSDCTHFNDGCTEGHCDKTDPNNPVCLPMAKTCSSDNDCAIPSGVIDDDTCINLFCDNGQCAHSQKDLCCTDDDGCSNENAARCVVGTCDYSYYGAGEGKCLFTELQEDLCNFCASPSHLRGCIVPEKKGRTMCTHKLKWKLHKHEARDCGLTHFKVEWKNASGDWEAVGSVPYNSAKPKTLYNWSVRSLCHPEHHDYKVTAVAEDNYEEGYSEKEIKKTGCGGNDDSDDDDDDDNDRGRK